MAYIFPSPLAAAIKICMSACIWTLLTLLKPTRQTYYGLVCCRWLALTVCCMNTSLYIIKIHILGRVYGSHCKAAGVIWDTMNLTEIVMCSFSCRTVKQGEQSSRESHDASFLDRPGRIEDLVLGRIWELLVCQSCRIKTPFYHVSSYHLKCSGVYLDLNYIL